MNNEKHGILPRQVFYQQTLDITGVIINNARKSCVKMTRLSAKNDWR